MDAPSHLFCTGFVFGGVVHHNKRDMRALLQGISVLDVGGVAEQFCTIVISFDKSKTFVCIPPERPTPLPTCGAH